MSGLIIASGTRSHLRPCFAKARWSRGLKKTLPCVKSVLPPAAVTFTLIPELNALMISVSNRLVEIIRER
jgi:hypothetical protein